MLIGFIYLSMTLFVVFSFVLAGVLSPIEKPAHALNLVIENLDSHLKNEDLDSEFFKPTFVEQKIKAIPVAQSVSLGTIDFYQTLEDSDERILNVLKDLSVEQLIFLLERMPDYKRRHLIDSLPVLKPVKDQLNYAVCR